MCPKRVEFTIIIILLLTPTVSICAPAAGRARIDVAILKDQTAPKAKPNLSQSRGKSGGEHDDARRQALLRREAKISMDEAREIANSVVPGEIKSGELTRDDRGHPVYNFNLLDRENHPVKVHVSALSGRVLHVEGEGKQPEFTLPKGIKRAPHSMKKKWSTLVRKIPI